MIVPIVFVTCSAIAIVSLCVACATRPNEVAAWAYLKSLKYAPLWLSKMILRPWYRTYLQIVGLAGLPIVAIWLYTVVSFLPGLSK